MNPYNPNQNPTYDPEDYIVAFGLVKEMSAVELTEDNLAHVIARATSKVRIVCNEKESK